MPTQAEAYPIGNVMAGQPPRARQWTPMGQAVAGLLGQESFCPGLNYGGPEAAREEGGMELVMSKSLTPAPQQEIPDSAAEAGDKARGEAEFGLDTKLYTEQKSQWLPTLAERGRRRADHLWKTHSTTEITQQW